jgi:hypothetical protein
MQVVQSVSDIESSTPDVPVMSATSDPVPPRGHVGLTRPVTDRNTGDYGHPRTDLSVFQVEAGSKSHHTARRPLTRYPWLLPPCMEVPWVLWKVLVQ